jgi:hypothetical protein
MSQQNQGEEEKISTTAQTCDRLYLLYSCSIFGFRSGSKIQEIK